MVRINRTGSQYRPIDYQGVDYATRCTPEDPAQMHDGLYYRSQTFASLKADVDSCRIGTMAYEQLSVEALQAWTESGWKTPHSSFDSVKRLGDKAHEEAGEVDDALEEFWNTRDKTHLIDELGDYLWVTSAFASNGSVVISDAIKKRLYAYAMGTKVRTSSGFEEPEWYDAAAGLATKRGSLNLGDLDDIISAGFVPRFSPVMNLYEKEEICCTNFAEDLIAYSTYMIGMASQQHGYNEDAYVPHEVFEGLSDAIGNVAAEVYFRVAAMAHFVGGSISEVVKVNIDKISKRIAAGMIDKTDCTRTNGLE